jgi:alpha-ketoglutarate-dependent taurine dioxygenase
MRSPSAFLLLLLLSVHPVLVLMGCPAFAQCCYYCCASTPRTYPDYAPRTRKTVPNTEYRAHTQEPGNQYRAQHATNCIVIKRSMTEVQYN